jgi:hypothetical protein
MERTRHTILLVFALAWATCGGKGSGPQSLLPGNNKIESWELAQSPILVDTEAGFYNRIDGGAPKYIERGWLSSAYAEYRKGGESIQVAVHDMGTPENAEALFNSYLPVARSEISYTPESGSGGRRPNAVVDLNLSSTYAACAFANRYYIEINIDSKTDAALADLTAFVMRMIEYVR